MAGAAGRFAFHPDLEHIRLNLFHGFNEPLLLSILTLALGSVFYLIRRHAAAIGRCPGRRDARHRKGLYELAMAAMARTAADADALVPERLAASVSVDDHRVFTLTTAGVWVLNADRLSRSAAAAVRCRLSQWLLVALMAAPSWRCGGSPIPSPGRHAHWEWSAPARRLFFWSTAHRMWRSTQLLVETLTLIIVSIVLLRLPPLDQTA